MTLRPSDHRANWQRKKTWARAWSFVLWSCTAACAALGSGCVVTPRQSQSGMTNPPQIPEGAIGADVAGQIRSDGSKTDFHAEATDRQSFQVHIDVGRVFESQGHFDAAVLEFQQALTVIETRRRGTFQAADSALAHRRMAGALDRLGQFAQAEVHYQKALKSSPKDSRVWNDVGYSYYLQGRWPDAERALRTAAKLAPNDERIRTNLGLTLAAAGKSNEAFTLLSQSSGDATGHANLGYLLAATGQFDLARRQYETALALRPDMELPRRALARLDRQQQNSDTPKLPQAVAQTAGPTPFSIDTQVKPAAAPSTKIAPPRSWIAPPRTQASKVYIEPPVSKTP
jgi:tetratricopeptide (TPR) repeat protein